MVPYLGRGVVAGRQGKLWALVWIWRGRLLESGPFSYIRENGPFTQARCLSGSIFLFSATGLH